MVRRKQDTNTGDLLNWQPPVVALSLKDELGEHGQLDNRIARMVGLALRDAREVKNLQRTEVATRMGAYLDRRADPMLDKWASEASDNHRIPLDAFVALIDVTGAQDLMAFIPEMFGFSVVPEKYTDIIELHLIDEHQREIDDRKSRLTARVRTGR